jgi:hypothetical protein
MRSLTILLNEPDQNEQTSDKIPKKIHVSWKDGEILNSRHVFNRHCLLNLAELNPEWQLELSIDEDVDEYLRDQLDDYDHRLIQSRHIVEKTDLWRLIKLYNEGGLYVDIDRLCDTSLNDILLPETRCLLPTCLDYNFSQDIMCSAPRNPIYSITAELILARRREGHSNTYFLGPQTYMHGVTKALLGEIVDVSPGEDVFTSIRQEISKMPFLQTYRENPPTQTVLYRATNTPFDHEAMKRDFYASLNTKHWTGEW